MRYFAYADLWPDQQVPAMRLFLAAIPCPYQSKRYSASSVPFSPSRSLNTLPCFIRLFRCPLINTHSFPLCFQLFRLSATTTLNRNVWHRIFKVNHLPAMIICDKSAAKIINTTQKGWIFAITIINAHITKAYTTLQRRFNHR